MQLLSWYEYNFYMLFCRKLYNHGCAISNREIYCWINWVPDSEKKRNLVHVFPYSDAHLRLTFNDICKKIAKDNCLVFQLSLSQSNGVTTSFRFYRMRNLNIWNLLSPKWKSPSVINLYIIFHPNICLGLHKDCRR